MTQRILVITGRYYPNPSANGICIKNVIDELHRHNCDVTCICYEDYRSCDYGTTKVYKVSRGLLHSLSYILEKYENSNTIARYIHKVIEATLRFSNLLYLPIWPWVDPFYTLKVFTLSVSLHKKQNFNSILAVHFPLSSIIIGHWMKWLYPRLKYYPYFLDPLSGGVPLRFISERWNINRALWWEDKILRNADKIYVMESHREHHLKFSVSKNYYKKMGYCDIPLLVRRHDIHTHRRDLQRDSNRIRVMFCGTMIYPLRNIYYFFSIIDKLKYDNIEFMFIGSTNVKQLETNNRDNVVYLSHICRDKLDYYYEQADIFLNFGARIPCAIPSKIFEYISYRKPIISTYSIDDEACLPYLSRYPLCLMIDEREGDIVKQASIIRDFVRKTYRKRVSEEFIGDEYKRNNPLSVVRELLQ